MNTQLVKIRTDLLKMLPKNLVIAEIGVFKGDFSQEIMEICEPSRLYLVDVFAGRAGSGDLNGNNMRITDMGEEYRRLQEKYKNKNVEFFKGYSKAFLTGLAPDSLDAIYIDADHSYSSVRGDLFNCYDKVKKGGFIMGHDFQAMKFAGLVKAVYEFCSHYELEINYLTQDGLPSYLIRK